MLQTETIQPNPSRLIQIPFELGLDPGQPLSNSQIGLDMLCHPCNGNVRPAFRQCKIWNDDIGHMSIKKATRPKILDKSLRGIAPNPLSRDATISKTVRAKSYFAIRSCS